MNILNHIRVKFGANVMYIKRVLVIILISVFFSQLGVSHSFAEDVCSNSNEAGWVNRSGTWYYYIGGSKAVSNWYYINGKYYYFNENGEMASDEIVNGWYVTKSGHWLVADWHHDRNGWWYGNREAYAKNGLIIIDGAYYYFDSNGYMKTGWIRNGSYWHYMNSSGRMTRNNWLKYADNWYYLNLSGEMATGWLKNEGKWYYLNPSGEMETGWLKNEGKWYFLNPSGVMETGWLRNGGRWYYLNSSGAMETGWQKLSGRWHYLDSSGSMLQNTWSQINGIWYYFEPDGSMASNKWIGSYYVNDSGAWDQNSNYGWSTRNGRTVYITNSGLAKGFQNINGYRYYFDSNGYLASKVGIDISAHNVVDDFDKVKKSGVDYVIIRSSATGYGAKGVMFLDSKYDDFMIRAKKAGLKVGIYHFSQAITEDEARAEARMAVSQARKYSLDLPIFMDMEVVWKGSDGKPGRTVLVNKEQMTKVALAFLKEVERAGYAVGFYSNPSELSYRVHDGQIVNTYPLWLAQYNYKPTYYGRYKYWQYSSTGSVPGIRGNVDMDIIFDNFQ